MSKDAEGGGGPDTAGAAGAQPGARSRAQVLVHDLANALARVVGHAGLVREELEEDSAAREHVDALMAGAERVRGLFDELACELGRAPAAPRRGSGRHGPPLASRPRRPPPGRRHVLVVDDEPAVRELTVAMLESLGLEAEAAVDGLEAVQRFERDSARFAAVLLDLCMPGVDGVKTFRALRRFSPEVPVVVISGFDEPVARERLREVDVAAFLQKPFTRCELRRALGEAFGEVGEEAGGT